ncbi:vesicle transport through interaction with t-SNAREs homolog 1A-like [Homarus americanus]|uniref:Vesicle transport through interaction with t-SNAREs homolog 1A n=1 Tax=Homarus americanus TaxID=6706 RepID=A0A8J5MR24_HOMAM|nr:vesicle transport through interaction with t-SNAREs homolog 1A-like [Homarus americanus]KAG7160793.1 Vesicle transport through interaction with t-SNAREs 1A-like [Homarus americanus]
MADLLPEFEQQFATVTADITSKICILPSREGAERRTVIHDVEKLVEEAKELLERMDLEVRDMEPVQREKLGGRLKSYQVELKRLEGEYSRIKSSMSNEASMRSELLEDCQAGMSVGEEQQQSLLDNTESLERTSTRITQGSKIAVETEHIGAQILNDLYSQRQTISHARERLRETDADLDQSSRVLNTMLRRVLQNRFILYTVLGIVAIVIIFAIYYSVSNG